MEVNKNKNQKNKVTGIASLKEGLSVLKLTDLQDIRKKLQIKNISSLKKAELIQYLAEAIPFLLRNIISQFDERQLFLIKNIISSNGVISAKNVEIEEMEYFPKTGFMFTGVQNGDPIIMIPLELLPSLGEIVQDEAILAEVKRNTEWIKITRGLLYYYGTVPHDKLLNLVEKYTPIRPDYLAFNYVIYDAIEYYQEIHIDRYGYSYWEVLDPLDVLEEQASRKNIDYYPFSKKQLLEAGETDYVERPKGYSQLLTLFTKEYRMPKQEAIEFVEDCIIHVKLGHPPSQLLQYIQTKLTFESLEAIQRLMDDLVLLMNNTRKWYLKGYTSVELSAHEKKALLPSPNKKGEVISLQTRQKIGRNDPCPCGSGKKFKKCCGN
ncbi:SEC-C metal-binding domain-containing protein [Neobacillus vireti]|uniref:SecC motif containing protein n=1 Tax=Neobacillus vireti LMG 21834 TaxID=1131730 RepID=A0AB94IS33_9BACI|nr:SEC-C metal-binding domain-containing protein [Neobacillus vireti]ETI69879.1 secC motif containing protein [Neobacillus vireti LMG 21834]KLT18175.1 secC motif containing protein [Neobacillus vireti]